MRTANPKRQKAGHAGGTVTLERYGREHFSVMGKKGGLWRLPTLQELRVEAAAEQIQKQGGEDSLNHDSSDLSLPELKRLWKLRIQERGRLAAVSPKEG